MMTWFVYLVIPGGLITHTMEKGSFESLSACQLAGPQIAQETSDYFRTDINWYCKRREPSKPISAPKITHLKEHDDH